jgi:molybdopterin-guanine dinucleotide biosynthesis protein MobB
MTIETSCPILGIAAFSGTGKTTLLRQLLPALRNSGLRIALVKHAHHDFEVDEPGKDSYELRKAGAAQMLLASARRSVLMIDHDVAHAPALEDLVSVLRQEELDLILVEGFKRAPIPKLELHRQARSVPALWPDDEHVIAIASDAASSLETELPLLNLNDVPQIASFVLTFVANWAAVT